MAEATTIADRAKRNGGDGAGPNGRPGRGGLAGLVSLGRPGEAALGAARALAGGLGGQLGRRITRRLTADLDDRDPDYIREKLPLTWLLTTLWFRGEVRNMANVPERGPVLLVGNHSGGTITPDTLLFSLAFSTYFGVERPFYQLAHNLVLASPLGPFLRRFGTVAASHEHPQGALDS